MISLYVIVLACTLYYLFTKYFRLKKVNTLGAKEVPMVKGALPIVGHGFSFSKDIIGFIRKAKQEYGNIFQIKIFRKKMVICCDHNMKDEFFATTESDMSLYEVLTDLYFADAFADDPATLPLIIQIVKQTIKVQFDVFAAKIVDEAGKMIERMRKYPSDQKIDLASEMIRFVACTSSRCFIAMDLHDDFFNVLMKFTNWVNRAVLLTYFFPKKLIRMVFNPLLHRYRMQIIGYLMPEIKKYRQDKTKKDSLVFRGAVDYVDKTTGRTLDDREIGEIIICLLYVSSENTALGLSATIIDLTQNEKFWQMVKNESKK